MKPLKMTKCKDCEKLKEALKQAIKVYYLDQPDGMTKYEFRSIKGDNFVKLSKLVKWKKGEKPFRETIKNDI